MSSRTTITPEMHETLTFRVIVVRHGNSEVLVADDGKSLVLPKIAIPKWTRITPEVADGVFRLTGLRTISLFHPEPQQPVNEMAALDVVLEPIDPRELPSNGFRWVSRAQCESLLSMDERRRIGQALAIADTYNSGTLNGAFARSGWMAELTSWAGEQLVSHGLKLTGEFRQLNCGPTFSLVRLETTGPAVWFKAVGEPNLREFPITMTLANHFPCYVPTLIATQRAWNGWLTFEADGSVLDEETDIAVWRVTARTLARLQIESKQRVPALLDAGCRLIQTTMLVDQIDLFFEVMAQLMAKQTKLSPPPLTTETLYTLAAQLKDACIFLAELNLPDTLGHMDCNPGNICGSSTGCVFLDWAEAYVGHPFYTLEYLRKHLSRIHPDKKAWQSEVTSCYLDPWISFASADEAARASEVTPLVAVLAYALSNNAWQDAERLENPKMAGYFRSLARRMQREAQIWSTRRQRCLW